MPVSSATLTKPTRDQIFEETANNVAYTCSATLPTDSSSTYQKKEYATLTYEWTFSDGGTSTSQSGSHIFTGLAIGAPNNINGTVKVYCTETVSTREDDYDWEQVGTNEDGTPKYDWVWDGYTSWKVSSTNAKFEVGSATTETHTIYTHPGVSEIFGDLAAEQIIEDNLTSGMVSDWCTHAGKWLSWYYQEDKYSGANGCKVSSEDWIEASWYNTCVSTVLASSPSVSGGRNGTIITPSYFQSLDTLVSRRE